MRPVMKYFLNRRQTINLNVFHGDVNHKNDVAGRLQQTDNSKSLDLLKQ